MRMVPICDSIYNRRTGELRVITYARNGRRRKRHCPRCNRRTTWRPRRGVFECVHCQSVYLMSLAIGYPATFSSPWGRPGISTPKQSLIGDDGRGVHWTQTDVVPSKP